MSNTISPNEFEAIGILYAHMYKMARTAENISRQRKIDLLQHFEARMEKAGYSRELIRAIARHALRDLLRAGYERQHLRWVRGTK